MFPYTAPTDTAEVVNFMLDIGAARTLTTKQGIHFYGTHLSGSIKLESIAAFMVYRFDTEPVDVINSAWYMVLGEQFTEDTHYNVTEMRYPDFCLLDKLAAIVTMAGIPRNNTLLVFELYLDLQVSIARAQASGVDSAMSLSKLGTTGAEQFAYCAAIQAFNRLDEDQRMDVLTRNLALDSLNRMLDHGMPYTLIADLYPRRIAR